MDAWALFSVSDKAGSVELARWFNEQGIGILASGGTYRHLVEHGITATALEDLTGFDEVLDGRVKTLHPVIYAGLLSRRTPTDQEDVEQLGSRNIVAVVVNLYPFRERAQEVTATTPTASLVEEIDVGGVSLIRAAAKNYAHVVVLVEPQQYPELMGSDWAKVTETDRLRWAAYAFKHVAAYDAAIALTFSQHFPLDADWVVSGIRRDALRYGENPHQTGAFYPVKLGSGFAGARQWQGKELSYNNLADADAAWGVVSALKDCGVAVIKHQNPAAVAIGKTALLALEAAHAADPISIFGGIVAFNREVSKEAAEALREIFLEVILAPGYDPAALEVLKSKKNLRVLEMPAHSWKPWEIRAIDGGVIVQSQDQLIAVPSQFEQVAGPAVDIASYLTDIELAWTTVAWAKSNAIVLAAGGVTRGIGSGQTNRVDAAREAIERAGEHARGAVLASDAFFPFGDVMELASQAGIGLVIQPGGSQRDQESIDRANQGHIPLFFTHERHFRH